MSFHGKLALNLAAMVVGLVLRSGTFGETGTEAAFLLRRWIWSSS